MEFNTVAVSDGITMGTEGMKASLVSRELIADSMELMTRAYFFDALVTVVACDKTIPAGAMALLRLNVPGLLVYGGSIMPGRLGDRDLTIQDVYEAVGEHAAGKITDEELKAIEDFACHGAGAGVLWSVGDGNRWRARRRPAQGRRRAPLRRASDGHSAAGCQTQGHLHSAGH
jgi:dihydroxy-acid dehydratase